MNDQKHHIDHMIHLGQIQPGDAKHLESIINGKLYDLSMGAPNITLKFQKSRIINYSDMSAIFSKDDLQKQIGIQMFDENSEKYCNPHSTIISETDHTFSQSLLFVARGSVIQKAGKLEDKTVPEVVFNQGNIVNLDILTGNGKDKIFKNQILYCGESKASLIPFNYNYLVKVLNSKSDVQVKLWKKLSYLFLILKDLK